MSSGWRIPREEIDASRGDRRLQRANADVVERARADSRLACPRCGDGSQVAWFYFTSPPWTWENLCGRAGPMAVCTRHEEILEFNVDMMN